MGFLGLFRKNEEPPPEPTVHKVRVEDLHSWLEKNLSGEMSEARKRTTRILGDISDSFRHISESAEKLGQSTFFGNDRLHTSANMLKDSFVKKTLSVSEQFHELTSHPLDRKSLKELHERMRTGLKEVKKTSPKQAVFLSRYFKKDSNQVVDNIKKAEENLDSLRELIEGDSVTPGFPETISESIGEITGLRERAAAMVKESDEMRDRVVYLRKLKEEKEKDYIELLKSREWKQINEREKELSEIREEAVRMEMDIRNELSALRRPMKKLEHDSGSLTKSQRISLKGFLNEPFETYILPNGLDDLRSLMKSLSDGMISGEIDLKDSDRERVMHFIKRGEPRLSEIRSRLLERREMMADVRKKIGHSAGAIKKKEELEEDVRRHSTESDEVGEKMKELSSELGRIKESMRKKREALEQAILDKTGKLIKISD
jgi:hypothetical protein